MAQVFRELDEHEKLFCELFVMGEPPFAGNLARCYEEAYGLVVGANKRVKKLASELFMDPAVKNYMENLATDQKLEANMVKAFLRENLKGIVAECSTKTYRDKKGRELSPAPLRSVAVAASKALMDLYPIKEVQTARLSIEAEDGPQGITFQVVVPEKKPNSGEKPPQK